VSLSIVWAFYPSQTTEQRTLDERKFQPFAIISKEPVSSTSSIYTLQPGFEPKSDPYAELWARGVWSVEFKQPQLQIARSYTPLPPKQDTAPGNLRFLIRREHKGEVSNYLDRLRVGAIIDVRGPRIEYEIPENVSEVVFLAGGTGIAPALQVLHTVLKQRSREGEARKKPRIHILWANRRREDCVDGSKPASRGWWRWSQPVTTTDQPPNKIVLELQDLKKAYEGKIKIDYMVDEEGTFIDKAKISKATSGSRSSNNGTESVRSGTKLLLLSGPDGFVNYFAGPKEWRDGREEQGKLGGVLAGLQLNDWRVVKL
jgi:cytochrome-b5 reductase